VFRQLRIQQWKNKLLEGVNLAITPSESVLHMIPLLTTTFICWHNLLYALSFEWTVSSRIKKFHLSVHCSLHLSV
jgi:hypothetical protein